MPLLENRCITPRVSSILGFPEEKGNASLVCDDDSSAVGCQKWSSSVAPLTAAALELGDMPPMTDSDSLNQLNSLRETWLV